jgi:hypothetical protein
MAVSSEAVQLVGCLKKRLEVISDREWYRNDPHGHLKALASVSEEIDRLGGVLMGDRAISPQLKHYLMKRSFDKALIFLETGVADDVQSGGLTYSH